MGQTIGLIAGWGEFPQLVAQAARDKQWSVVAIAFPEETDPKLEKLVDQLEWVSIGQLGKIIKFFKQAGVSQAMMAGMIRHKRLFSNLKLDLKAISLLARLKDKRADSILRAVAEALEREGISLISPLPILGEYLPGKGVITKAKPTSQEKQDIEFGYRIAKHVASEDIGQTVVVKNRAVLAVEAMEGTDACIRRAGEFTRQGAVVVKVVKPKQDFRFDTPVIGPETIASMKKGHAHVLAFDAGKTLFIRKDQTIQAANQAKIVLIGI